MSFHSIDCGMLPVSANVSHFQGPSGVDEFQVTLRPTEHGSINTQLDWLCQGYQQVLGTLDLDLQSAVLRRFFCSDLSSQALALRARSFSNPHSEYQPSAVSWVCQPPAPPAKAALWAYHVSDPGRKLEKRQDGATLSLTRGALSHHWTTGLTCPNGATAYEQTRGILEQYDALLRGKGLTLAGNVVRTWFFVRDIDANYQGLVMGRREFYAERGLTPHTHFIASSGIEGTHVDISAKVVLDAYAISGVRPEQVEFLKALDHLSPTHIYGVTFERGVSVAYRDRKHVIISGTASIGPQGDILYPGDLSRQLDRSIENVEALLEKAGATLRDMCVFIVYIRDPADHSAARQQMRERFNDVPISVVVAPVCRPGWLIEVEGIAIVAVSNPGLPEF